MKAQQQGARIARAETIAHQARPEAAGGAILGNLLEQVAMRIEEERKPGREFVHCETRGERGIDVGDGIGERKAHFLHGGRAGFANVIAGDGDRGPARQFLLAPGKEVGHDAHGRARRIDIGAARDIFLEDIVLYGAREVCEARSLLPGHGDIQGEENRRRGVDGHRSGDLAKRDAFKQSLHILERADGHADLAHLAARAGMVGIESHLGGQIEGDGKTRLALREQIAITLIGLPCRAEAGILPHGPELAAVHRGIDPARVGKFAGLSEG